MRYVITHLKAPWPLGAVVGDVLAMQVLPAWAVGKCAPAPEDAEITVELDEVCQPEEPQDQAVAMARHFREQAQAAIDKAAEAHALELAELRAALDQANGTVDALRGELDASKAFAAELQGHLDAKAAAVALQEAEAQAAAERAAADAKAAKGKTK